MATDVFLRKRFSEHCQDCRRIHKLAHKTTLHTIGKIYKLLKTLVSFYYTDEDMLRKFIVMAIQPILEYAPVVWFSQKMKNIRKIERIQRAARKMVLYLRGLTHELKDWKG